MLFFNCYSDKSTNRCVCGCSSLITSHDGIDNGYCEGCAMKRKKFTDSIIGTIEIENKNTLCNMINVIENLRKSFLQERIYFMIDKYFSEHQFENFKEPYNDDEFIARVYKEKYSLMKTFMSSIFLQTKAFSKDKHFYDRYIEELNTMIKDDDDKLEEINAKLGGYSYSKKFQNKNH